MATSTAAPVGEYLRTSYHPDREWVAGEVRERNMGERPHAALQKFFLRFFMNLEAELGVVVYPELRTQVSRDSFRVPDVLVLLAGDPKDRIVRVAPQLCIEILSPDDRMMQVNEKIEDYLRMGVRAVWVLDPTTRKAFVADVEGTRTVKTLAYPGSAVELPVETVFAELDGLESE